MFAFIHSYSFKLSTAWDIDRCLTPFKHFLLYHENKDWHTGFRDMWLAVDAVVAPSAFWHVLRPHLEEQLSRPQACSLHYNGFVENIPKFPAPRAWNWRRTGSRWRLAEWECRWGQFVDTWWQPTSPSEVPASGKSNGFHDECKSLSCWGLHSAFICWRSGNGRLKKRSEGVETGERNVTAGIMLHSSDCTDEKKSVSQFCLISFKLPQN